jgi:hypothetical protein
MTNNPIRRARAFAAKATGKTTTTATATAPLAAPIATPALSRSDRGGIFARNPLAAERMTNPVYAQLAQRSPAPTLFANGDVPPFTSSGNDPKALLELPWQLRQAAARADQQEWARLFADYAHDDVGLSDLLFEPAAAHPENAAYAHRVADWAAGRS